MPTAIRVIDQAVEIVVDASGFSGNLSVTDTDVQTALATVDGLSIGGGSPGGSDTQIQYNNSSSFGGAAGFTYQAAASPNVTIQAQNAAYVPLLLKAAASQSTDIWQIQKSDGTVYAGADERGILYSYGGVTVSNTFLGNNAGRPAATGLYSVGIGEAALAALTSGNGNVAIGAYALNVVTTGANNMAVGTGALRVTVGGGANVAVGYQALYTNISGGNNVGIGDNAGYGVTGDGNVAIGSQSLYNNGASNQSVSIGMYSGYRSTGAANVYIGYGAGLGDINYAGANNVRIGHSAGYNNRGVNTVIIGAGANQGASGFTSSSSVFIGYQAGYSETSSNRLYISNSNTATPLIYGEFDNARLKVNGDFGIKLYSQDAEPTIGADEYMALWKDTDDSNRIYLIFRRGTGDQVKVELT